MSNFHVGQKVVCVDDRWVEDEPQLPMAGVVYTIREIDAGDDGLYFRLHELVNPVRKYRYAEMEASFEAAAFRPVAERKTDISIFRAMLEPKKARADA